MGGGWQLKCCASSNSRGSLERKRFYLRIKTSFLGAQIEALSVQISTSGVNIQSNLKRTKRTPPAYGLPRNRHAICGASPSSRQNNDLVYRDDIGNRTSSKGPPEIAYSVRLCVCVSVCNAWFYIWYFWFSMYDILRAPLSKCHTYIVLDMVFLAVECMAI